MYFPNLINQKPYEKIVYVLRRHPVTFVPMILFLIILLALPIFLYFLLHAMYASIFSNDVLLPLLILGASVYTLSVLLFFYTAFSDYYLDISVITNDRIIDMEQAGLFSKITTELELYRIQDVTSNTTGMFATFFDYGTVFVKTSSENSHIAFTNIPHPNAVRNDLINLAEGDKKFHNSTV